MTITRYPAAIGIDPGKDGAVVMLGRGRVVLASERTVERCIVGKEYNDDAMAALIQELLSVQGYEVQIAILEKQHAMPGQGGTSMFSIGTGYGLWRGVLAALGVPRQFLRAADWQKEIAKGQSGDPKTRSILVAQRALPGLDLLPGQCRKPHTGLADAGCMALVGLGRI